MVATAGGAGLTKVLQSVMPMLSKVVNDIVLPRMDCYRDHCEVEGLQYQVDEIKVKHFTIGEVKVAFIAGKGLQLTLGEIRLQLEPTHFTIKKSIGVTKLQCSGTFHAALTGARLVEMVNITAVGSDGTPKITPSSSWTWGHLAPSIYLPNPVCKAVKNVFEWCESGVMRNLDP